MKSIKCQYQQINIILIKKLFIKIILFVKQFVIIIVPIITCLIWKAVKRKNNEKKTEFEQLNERNLYSMT